MIGTEVGDLSFASVENENPRSAGPLSLLGVLRLRNGFAKRSRHSAQDDIIS